MHQFFDLTGRVALVTGASSGLGRHFALLLAERGARVVAAARREERLQSLVDEIRGVGGQAVAVSMDVTSPADIAACFDQGEQAFGTIELVVNNAGIGWGGRLEEMPADDWERMLTTNLGGVHHVAAETARRLIAAGRPGSIVNIASILGTRVATGNAAYNATKAAVIQLSRSQALEWARHAIRVNSLCPGFFPTEINSDYLESEAGQAMLKRIPMRRVGRTEELDAPLLLLLGDEGSFITGTEINVDGGHLCSSL
jgi:NAD(P)-dependent dehydrogenase (short-subunit alcohol dehydrogenase family)